MSTDRPPKRSRRNAAAAPWLDGGGEMGDRIRALDWSRTPIGPMESWSPALRMMVRFLLANRVPAPAVVGTGLHLASTTTRTGRCSATSIPWALGQPVRQCWSEIWHVLQPLIDTPFHGGPADLERRHRARDQSSRLRRGNAFHDRLQSGARRDGRWRHRRRARDRARDHRQSRRRAPRRRAARSRRARGRGARRRRKRARSPPETLSAHTKDCRSCCSTSLTRDGGTRGWPVRPASSRARHQPGADRSSRAGDKRLAARAGDPEPTPCRS